MRRVGYSWSPICVEISSKIVYIVYILKYIVCVTYATDLKIFEKPLKN